MRCSTWVNMMPEGPAKEETLKVYFEKLVPSFLSEAEKVLEHGKKFLLGDNLNTCDFYIGGYNTNMITTPNV